MKKALVATVVLSFSLVAIRAASQEGKKVTPGKVPVARAGKKENNVADKPSVWMKMKMKHSQQVFEAIARADMQAAGDAAKQMSTLNWFEQIVKGKNELYQQELWRFRLANKQLIQYAEKENIEGATLAFIDLTLSCVDCHKKLRDAAVKTDSNK